MRTMVIGNSPTLDFKLVEQLGELGDGFPKNQIFAMTVFTSWTGQKYASWVSNERLGYLLW